MNIELKRIMAEFSYGLPITIGRIGIGSELSEIPNDLIVSSSPRINAEIFSRNDNFFRILKDGSEKQLSPEECYDLVVTDGGCLHSEYITWNIENKSVKYIFLKGPLLTIFNIESEKGIVELFGKPECILMNGIGTEYNYMSRKLRLLWSKHDSCLYSVDIGDFRESKKTRKEDAGNGIFHIGGIRRVRMTNLEQRHTYSGLIAGSPTERVNDSIIEEVRATAVKECSAGRNVHIFRPRRTRYETRRGNAFGRQETIPPIACVAELTSAFPVKDFEHSGSSAIIVWFQNQWAMPIDKEIIEEIELLNWREIAWDFSD